MTFIMIITTIWIVWFSKRCRDREFSGRWSFIKNITKKSAIRMSEILLFGYFIRSFLEMVQFSAISSIHEVLKFDASEVFSLISLIVALCYITTLIIIFGFMLYLALSSYIVEENEHNKLGDFFEGMKMKRSFKFYAPMMIARRVIFVLLLVSLNSISSKTLIWILSFLQLLYIIYHRIEWFLSDSVIDMFLWHSSLFRRANLAKIKEDLRKSRSWSEFESNSSILLYVGYLRPYSEIKWNIIDILNEVYFLLLLFILIFLNEEKDWSNIKSSTYIWIIASSSMITFCIVFSKFSCHIF